MMSHRPEAVALISGGKDSLLALYHAIANGYNIVALGNLHPPTLSSASDATAIDDSGTSIYLPAPSFTAFTVAGLGPAAQYSDELDSYMYQTIGHTVLPLYAQCLNLPLYRRPITGGSVNMSLDYEVTAGEGDETEDLTLLLQSIRKAHPNIVAVTSGAILSTYQRTRIESVCARLGLTSLAYLWQMSQEGVLEQLGTLGFDARIVKVAALGLDESWLWSNVADPKVVAKLARLKERWGINPAGEGGEYETLVVSAPGWRGRIEVPEEGRVVNTEGGGAAWVGFTQARVVPVEGGERRQEEWAAALQPQSLYEPGAPELLPAILPAIDIIPGQTASSFPSSDDATPLAPALLGTPTTHQIANVISPTPCGSLAEELAAIFAVVKSHLHPRPLTDLTATTLLLRNMSDFAELNTHYSSYFPLPLPPARVCVSVPHFPAGRNIMLSATYPAAAPHPRKGLHVQSRSYWAPANIGPYSQAVLSGSHWEVAGQIPLVPANMELIKTMQEQCVLALQHLHRIWRAVGAMPKAAVAWIVDEAAVPTVVETWRTMGGEQEALLVLLAKALPRGAGVEWAGCAVEEEEGDVVVATEGVEVDEGQMVTVFAEGSVQAFLKQWQGKTEVAVVPVGAVWDGWGERRAWGCVVRRG
jgi:diphthine-ammonia ligase